MAKRLKPEEVIAQIVDINSDAELLSFAKELKELFPKGKQTDTGFPFRSHPVDLKNKLLGFYPRYGFEYTKEQIIDATKRYVDHYSTLFNYSGMRIAKYFIWKELPNGEVISDLATYLETEDDEGNESTNWVNSLV